MSSVVIKPLTQKRLSQKMISRKFLVLTILTVALMQLVAAEEGDGPDLLGIITAPFSGALNFASNLVQSLTSTVQNLASTVASEVGAVVDFVLGKNEET